MRRIVLNLVIVAIALLVAIAAGEVLLRVIEPESNVQVLQRAMTANGPYLSLRPGASGLILGRAVSVNGAGYRGEERPREKPAGVSRVLFFGDSHTFSMGAADADAYPAVVESLLRAQGMRVQVLNFGVLGQDLRQILTHVRNHALDHEPDLVVVTFHSGDLLETPEVAVEHDTVDAGVLYRIKRDLLKHSFLARLVLPYGAVALRQILGWSPPGVTLLEEREVLEDGPAWRRAKERIVAAREMLEASGASLAFVLFPSMTPFEDHPARATHEAIARWLSSQQIPVVDLLPAFAGESAAMLTASLLDKHPNERGYRLAAEAVAPLTGDILRGADSR